jgi:hypothetical protein
MDGILNVLAWAIGFYEFGLAALFVVAIGYALLGMLYDLARS